MDHHDTHSGSQGGGSHPPHEHGHHHHGESGGHTSLAEANRTHFNVTAHTYDDIPFAKDLCKQISSVILEEYAFDKDATVVMEFACGTGLISGHLAPHAKQILGVDISQGMVDQYNKRVVNQGIPPEKMHGICHDLKGEEGELNDQKFDLIFCSMAYHHFDSIGEKTRILASFLRPGGTLIVVDHLKVDTDESLVSSAHKHLVSHGGGFEEQAIRKLFEDAKLEKFAIRPCSQFEHEGKTKYQFLAKGVKGEE